MAFSNLGDILKLIIEWESRLSDYYKHLRKALKNERAKAIVELLAQQQEEALSILGKIDISEYKHAEFIKNTPDYHNEVVIPQLDVRADISPAEILERTLGFEEKLEEYYSHLRRLLVYKKSLDLLDMLSKFKLAQIKRIKSFMDSYDLVM